MTRKNTLQLRLLTDMIRGRAVEDAIRSVTDKYHASRGEEAIIAGAYGALDNEDVCVPHYRGAVIASLVRGADPRELLAGILGKATGPTRGRHRGDFVGKFAPTLFGCFSGTLGPNIGYATGSGLAATLDGSRVVTVTSFGDGTANSGLLYESLNLAAIYMLPVVFVCHSNQFAISLPASESVGGGSFSSRAAAFGMPAMDVDGNDAVAIYETVRGCVDRARRGEGPSFVNALTYRVDGHWVSDPCEYRDPVVTTEWEARDPINLLAESLIAECLLDTETFDAIKLQSDEEISVALAKATSDPWPGVSVIDTIDAFAPQEIN